VVSPGPARGRRVLGEAFRLAWPATLALLLHAGYRVNDQYWIQDLGPPAQAALGVTSFLLILNFAFVTLVHAGTLARTAHATGAGDAPRLRALYSTATRLGFGWFALVGLAGWLATPLWVRALGATGEVAPLAAAYLRPIYLCLPLIGAKPLLDGVFIGRGDTLTPMLLSAASVGLNFLLNPLLIYGAGPIPAMGIAGAAWATVLARGAAATAAAVLLARRGLPLAWRAPFLLGEARRILAIGAPVALSTGGYALVFVAVLKTTIEPFGESVQAGLGVAFNGVEAISYCALMGPAVAAASMVGRRLGAGDTAGARAAVRACLLLSCLIASAFTAAFLLIPDRLAGLYTGDPVVLRQASLYLWVVGWTQVVTAAQAVFEQALAGAGHTLGMSLFNLAGNGVRIPAAWLLAHGLGLGPAGAWWALNLSNILKLGAIVWIYRAGRWQRSGSVPPLPRTPACPQSEP